VEDARLGLLTGLTGQVSESVRDWGVRDTFERVLCKIAMKTLSRGFRKTDMPSFQTLCAAAQTVYDNPEQLLRGQFGVDEAEIALLRQEYDEHNAELSRRYADRRLDYPRPWAFGSGSAFVLYALVRTMSPKTVLETGVANGHSSFFILQALSRNSSGGTLHSIDVSTNVGTLIEPAERARWDLRLLSRSAPKKDFVSYLDAMPAIDLMIHDSDHTYRWMDFELETALSRLSASGLIVCDDTDLSFALIDFCERHSLKPVLLVDAPKVLGLLAPNGGTSAAGSAPTAS
jgi:predicted O-methyltransferase YrrM